MANILYMEVDPFKLTDIETEETKEFDCLQELLDEALKKSYTIYSWDLDDLSEVIINKFFNMGYTEVPTADLETFSSKIESKQFVQIGSTGTTGSSTFQIRIRRNNRIQSVFRNASKLFGDATIEDLIEATLGELDLEFETTVMCERLRDLIAEGHTSLTLAGNAKKDLINRCFGRYVDGKWKFGDIDYRKDNKLPKLSDDIHNFVMKSFQGGICYYNKDFEGTTDVEGTSYDVNSMYPSVMLQEALPYGIPVEFEGQYVPVMGKGYPLYFQEVNISRIALKADGIPCVKNRTEEGYYTEAENINLVLNHVDLEMLFDNYEVDGIEYVGGYKFEARKKMFDNFINYWAEQKQAAEDGSFERMYAKLMLNSAFGKFAERIDKQPTYYKYSKLLKKYKRIPYTKGKKQTEGNSMYAPVGCYITSYARQRLLAAIKANKENFIYSDTDSIYVEGEAVGLELDSKKFGAWKEEFKFKKINIIGKKQYCVLKEDDSLKVVLAGVPDYISKQIEVYEDFYVGKEFKYSLWGFDNEGLVIVKDNVTSSLKDHNIR